MIVARTLKLFSAGLVAAAMLASPAKAQEIVGDALVDRANQDGFANFVFVLPFSFGAGSLGQTVANVRITDGIVGRTFTPLIVANTSGTMWTITGVGTERTVTSTGLTTFGFGLTSGSDIITTATRLAFHTGAMGGAISFDTDSDGNSYSYTGNGSFTNASLTAGTTFSDPTPIDRAYSIQFQALPSTAVPEPSTFVLTAAGMVAFVVARRRRAA